MRIEGIVVLGGQYGRRKKNAVLWAVEEKAKGHICGYGYGQKMLITYRHYTIGLPKDLRGRNAGAPSCRNGVEASTMIAGDAATG